LKLKLDRLKLRQLALLVVVQILESGFDRRSACPSAGGPCKV